MGWVLTAAGQVLVLAGNDLVTATLVRWLDLIVHKSK